MAKGKKGGVQGQQIIGTDFDDHLYSTKGNDLIDGGLGYDVVDYSGSSKSVKVNLAAGTATGQGNDTLLNVEDVIGSSRSDKLTGDADDNILDGGKGNDHLVGNGGDDWLIGGAGNDKIIAAWGDDWIDAGSGNDNITSGAGDDDIYAGAGNDKVVGGAGNDWIDGGAGKDNMIGGAGDDTYYVDAKDKVNEVAGGGNDTIVTNSSYSLAKLANVENLTLDGGADINATGNSADNVLIGNSGDNVLDGRAGDDVLIGEEGDDLLIGGSGDDIFVFDNLDGVDLVQDFTIGSDQLGLDSTVFTAFSTLTGDPIQVQDGNLVLGDAAVDADDFLIFDTSTGALSYDADANGLVYEAVQIATVGVSSLEAVDFLVA